MNVVYQFFLLMWKNVTIHRRKLGWTIAEILLPTLFAFVLLILKLSSNNEDFEKSLYEEGPVGLPQFPKILGFVPSSPAAKSIADIVIQRHLQYLISISNHSGSDKASESEMNMKKNGETHTFVMPTSKGFDTIEAAEKFFDKNKRDMTIVLELRNLSGPAGNLPKRLTVILHPFRKESQVWHTGMTKELHFNRMPRDDTIDQGFAYMELLVGRSILATWLAAEGKNVTGADFALSAKRFPVPPYVQDAMFQTVHLQLTLFMVLSFMMSVFMHIKNVLHEKENGIKESMRLMGMNLVAFWLSWFVTCFLFMTPAIVIFTLVLKIDFKGDGALLSYSQASVIFVLLICYGLCVVSFALTMTCIVSKGSEGVIVGGVLFIMTYVPHEIIYHRVHQLSRSTKFISCIFSNVAMGLANHNTMRREARMEGVKWSNIDDYIIAGKDDFTHMDSIKMLLFDVLLHFLLIWYLDNVFPGEFGVPRPYLFFLTKTYWCGSTGTVGQDHPENSLPQRNAVFFEKEPSNLKPGVQIKGLRKIFGTKVSVSNLTLNMYEGQITVLLGHNGAGKTTTMSMLTGFIPPTKGTALVNGYDIRKNIQGVRKSLGLCPQHDILFDVLTVKEHLWFFAKLKGYQTDNLTQEIKAMVSDIGLENKAKARVSKISGGQKRSLSVGIALMGNSKVVFLDEPSSGMDPSTRRLTWDLLQSQRKGRTVLLSTHYMDEADALGNRIAILVEGKLQCCGTPLFLKKLYGAGYHLIIEKDPKCDLKKLTAVIQGHVPTALMESVHTFEVSYLLPDTECRSFPELFMYLSEHKESLHITAFGTTSTTMEEVFLRSEQINDELELSQSSENRSSVILQEGDVNIEHFDNLNRDIRYLKGYPLAWSQFRALLKKRLIVALRHWPVTLLLYTLPAFIIFLYFLIKRFMTPLYDTSMDLVMFYLGKFGREERAAVFVAAGEGDSDLAKSYISLVQRQKALPVYVTDSDASSLDDFLLAEQDSMGRVQFERKYPLGILLNRTSGGIVALYNGQTHHALFVSISLIVNAVAMSLLGPSHELTVGLKPLPGMGELEMMLDMAQVHQSGFLIGMFVGMGYSIYTSSVVKFLLWEKQANVKHMHAISGVSMVMYWAPTFVWDAASFICPTILLFLLINYVNERAFLDGNNWAICILAMVLFVWAILPVTYAVHFAFESASQGLAGILVCNLFTVLLANIVVFELNRPTADTDDLGWWTKLFAIMLIPSFNLSESFKSIHVNYHSKKQCEDRQPGCRQGYSSLCCRNHPDICTSELPNSKCYEWSEFYLDMDIMKGIGCCLVALVIQGILAWLAVFAIEYSLVQRCYLVRSKAQNTVKAVGLEKRSSCIEEDDVLVEKDRVFAQAAEIGRGFSDPLLLVSLKKRYGPVKAVDGLSVGVAKSQCFGLLGQSGAGKTTVFRMLTGETAVTKGTAFLNGVNVRTNLRAVQKQIGYCPQADAHIGELTATETLHLYGRLRGIPPKDLEELVKTLIKIVLLGPHAHRRCGNYSGGNRRKLSLAMALVGNPDFLLLDEPSCGMDPKARRQMWDVLSRIRASGRTLVVSSHSMEECDALCTKLAILLHGRLMCLGSPQHLKSKYGQGYTLVIKMGTLPDGSIAPTEPVVDFIQKAFPDTVLFDDHQGYVHLQIKDQGAELADVFSQMEECRGQMEVEDYSVNETTLEQVFLMFTMIQNLDEEKREESCWFLRSGFFDDHHLCF